ALRPAAVLRRRLSGLLGAARAGARTRRDDPRDGRGVRPGLDPPAGRDRSGRTDLLRRLPPAPRRGRDADRPRVARRRPGRAAPPEPRAVLSELPDCVRPRRLQARWRALRPAVPAAPAG